MAPPFTLTLSQSTLVHLAPSEQTTEAKASLTSKMSMSFIGHPGLGQHLGRRGDGTVEVVVGVGAHQHLGHDRGPGAAGPRPWPGPRTSRARRRRRRRSATSSRRCACRRAARASAWPGPRPSCHAGPWSLATTIFSPSARRVGPSSPTTGASTATISRSKRPSAPARGGLLLRLEAEPVDVGPGDAVLLGDPLGRAELVGHVPGEVRRARARPAPLQALAPSADPAHGLDAAGDARRRRRRRAIEVGHEVVGLLRRAALAVDRWWPPTS